AKSGSKATRRLTLGAALAPVATQAHTMSASAPPKANLTVRLPKASCGLIRSLAFRYHPQLEASMVNRSPDCQLSGDVPVGAGTVRDLHGPMERTDQTGNRVVGTCGTGDRAAVRVDSRFRCHI